MDSENNHKQISALGLNEVKCASYEQHGQQHKDWLLPKFPAQFAIAFVFLIFHVQQQIQRATHVWWKLHLVPAKLHASSSFKGEPVIFFARNFEELKDCHNSFKSLVYIFYAFYTVVHWNKKEVNVHYMSKQIPIEYKKNP